MNAIDAIDKLNELANIKAMCDALALQKAELIKTAIHAEVKARLDEIEAEFSDKLTAANEKAAALEAEVKTYVLAHGMSIKGDYLHAIYVKGRVTWDTKGIEGFAVAHPELNTFRKVGEPSVSIRKV